VASIHTHFLSHCKLGSVLFAAFLMFSSPSFAESIPATHRQGSLHGLLLLKSQTGKTIAIGDQTNIARGDEIRSELIFHFLDGSIDDEVADFRQGSVFQLIRDHHIQKGPSFPKPLDLTVEVSQNQVTWREVKDGKSETQSEHMDLPADLVNGLIALVVENFPSRAEEWKTSYLAADSKPRLVQFSFKPDGEDQVRVGTVSRKTMRYNVHVDIGGIAGVIAPIIGKQPSDIKLWVLGGDAPMLIRMEGALYPEGPIWTMVLTSPEWPSTSSSSSSSKK
jgi:hypothetical protein